MTRRRPTDQDPERHRRRLLQLGAPMLVAALGAIVYAGTLNVPFIFDDYNAIVENPHIRALWPPGKVLTAPDQSTVAGRPVASLTLALNHAVSGLKPWSYHLFNVSIHVLTGLLLFGVARRTLELRTIHQIVDRTLPQPGDRPLVAAESAGAPVAFGTAWALALASLWMVHPLHTEVVTYVSTRTEGLVGLFYVLTMYSVVRAATESDSTRRWQGTAVVACALAMATKEVAAPLPVLVLLFDGVLLSDGIADALRRRRGLYAGLASTWLILFALVALGPRSETVGIHFGFMTPLDYLRTQVGVIWHYLRLVFWPQPLVLDYSDWPVTHHFSVEVVVGGLALLGLVAASAWLLVRRSWLGFLGCWFFLILAPSSSLIPITSEVAAERRMYLPLMAIAALFVAGLWRLAGALAPNRRHLVLAAVSAPMVVGLGALTIDRNRVYTDEVGIWEDTVRKRPSNLRAVENLGAALVSHDRRREAVPYLERALDMNPDSHRALGNLGLIRLDEGRFEEALQLLSRSAALQPDDAISRLNLAKAQVATGDWEGAAVTLEQTLRMAPDSALGHARLALVRLELGDLDDAGRSIDRALALDPDSQQVAMAAAKVRLALGQHEQAASLYRTILEDDPGNVEGLAGLVAALSRSGEDGEVAEVLDRLLGTDPNPKRVTEIAATAGLGVDQGAGLAIMDAAVQRWPQDADLRLAQGRLRAAAGRDAEALESYREALRLRPRWADAGNSLALLWATATDPSVRNPEWAVRLARELSAAAEDRHPVLLSTLGVALVSAGQRSEGEVVLERAIALAVEAGQQAVADELGKQLERVREGWPPPAP